MFRLDTHVLLGRMNSRFVVDEFEVVVRGRTNEPAEKSSLADATTTLGYLVCGAHGRRPVHELKKEIHRTHGTGRIRRSIKI